MRTCFKRGMLGDVDGAAKRRCEVDCAGWIVNVRGREARCLSGDGREGEEGGGELW